MLLTWDDDFSSQIASIKNNVTEVENLMKELQSPPEDMKAAHTGLLNLYDSYIEITNLDAKDENSKKTILSLYKNDQKELESFVNYFKNNVVLVRVILPEDTDVASYFEIMNNRGEQLQKHEIIKARLLEKIQSAEGRKTFAKIRIMFYIIIN